MNTMAAEDVAAAFFIENFPSIVISGTRIVPPPTPKSPEKNPEMPPIPAASGAFIRVFSPAGSVVTIRTAPTIRTAAKRMVSTLTGRYVAAVPPRNPVRIPAPPIISASRQITLPCFVCDSAPVKTVGSAAAKLVPNAVKSAASSGTPDACRTKNIAGAKTNPPPTPSRPDIQPAKIPTAIKKRMKISSIYGIISQPLYRVWAKLSSDSTPDFISSSIRGSTASRDSFRFRTVSQTRAYSSPHGRTMFE